MTDKASLLNNPYGQSSFCNFRTNDTAYADKTGFIAKLDKKSTSRYPVLLRPRRFGKSTFVMMLKCFYDISYRDRYDELFSGTHIYSLNLPAHNTYHVIDFDFSKISGNDTCSLVNSFVVALNRGIGNFRKRYPDFVFSPREKEQNNPADLFTTFLTAYEQYSSGEKLYVMIDEYDNFANNLLSRDIQLFKTITSAGGFLKDFYATVKDGTKDCIAKTFITGVSSVSLDSLTTGFNISLNITSEKDFNDYAGFTESELRVLVPNLVDTDRIGICTDELISCMKPVYDGYCFSQYAKQTVFNSSMCLYYLYKIQSAGKFLAPENCLDPASDHDGSKLQKIFQIAEIGLADKILDSYLGSEKFYLKKLSENLDLNKTSRYNRDQLLSTLFYLGYLTIDADTPDDDGLILKIPNLYMSKLFAICTMDLRLKSKTAFTDSALDITSLLNLNDDITPFANSCTKFLSFILSNQVLPHMSEMALNLALYAKLESLTDDNFSVEMQKFLMVTCSGEMFADLVITVNRGRSNECIYLIELKYITKTEASEKKSSCFILAVTTIESTFIDY